MAEAVGCAVEYSDAAAPWVIRPAIASLDQIDRLPTVAPLCSPALSELIKATRIVAKAVGDSVCVRGQSDQGPFSLAAQILGAEAFMLSLLDSEQTAKIHRLLRYASDQIARLARAQAAAGAHLTLIGDSIAGPDVCSPKLYRIFAQPYEKRLIDSLRREGIETGIHICGNATSIVPDIADTGTLYVELDHKIDRPCARAATKWRTTIFGTLDPHGLLVHGTPEEVMAAAHEDIRLLGDRGRFVLSPGCTIAPETPVRNVHALVEAARHFGQYRGSGALEG
jgi:MtaA/CmuA family methyltransferase